jgi:hypothetical protein
MDIQRYISLRPDEQQLWDSYRKSFAATARALMELADKFAIHGDDEESDAIVEANVELFRAFDEVIQKIDLELARAFLTVVERER